LAIDISLPLSPLTLFKPSLMPSTRVIDVAAGLIFHNGKLLITQRYPDSHLGGLWEFPGGKREGHENFEHCLARELREELGIEVIVGDLVESLAHEYPGKTVNLRFFRCCWTAGKPQALGCSAFKWISATELKDYEFPAADVRLLQRLAREVDWWKPGNRPTDQTS
jgi:mutator protein MutT